MASFFKAIKYVSIFNYGYDVLMINQWQHSNVTCIIVPVCETSGLRVLDNAKIDLVRLKT